MDAEASSRSPHSLQERYILTQVGQQRLAFPSQWVAEILLIERSQILALPFYDPLLLGVVHHHGQIVPLVAIQPLLEGSARPMRETISVVQLGEVGGLAGVGVVVDQALENRSHEQLPINPSEPEAAGSSAPETPVRLFEPQMLGDRLWQPQRWQLTQATMTSNPSDNEGAA